jgi:hypothetical protein
VVTVVTDTKIYSYETGTSASVDSRGQLTVHGAGLTEIAGLAPGEWKRYRTVDEVEKDDREFPVA